MNKIKKISIICLFALSFLPVLVSAQGKGLNTPNGAGTSASQPLIGCGSDRTGTELDACGAADINVLIHSVVNLFFIFAGFVVAAMFMYAGFLLITAGGNPGQIQKAKTIFKRVVIGFLIMFLSYILVKNLLTNIKAADFFMRIFK